MPFQIGEVIADRFCILGLIAEGGMAVVYKAHDTRLDMDVAIKMIHPTRDNAEKLLERFAREARISAQMNHPNIVKIIDYGEYEQQPFLVMDYIAGGSLKDRLAKGPFPLRAAVQLLIPIAQALAYAHSQGVVHRDVKPGNILITDTGMPVLSDFGIVKILTTDETRDEDFQSLTSTGTGIGTPAYMAPEQARGLAIDGRADIYALGVVFYEMLTGRTPYEGPTPLEVLLKKTTQPLPDPRIYKPDLPEAAFRALQEALATDPKDRFQSMNQFASALKSVAQGQYRTQKFPWKTTLWVAGSIVGFLCIAGIISLLAFKNLFGPLARPGSDNTNPPAGENGSTPASSIAGVPGGDSTVTKVPSDTPVIHQDQTLTPSTTAYIPITPSFTPAIPSANNLIDFAFITGVTDGNYSLHFGNAQDPLHTASVPFSGSIFYPTFCGQAIIFEGHLPGKQALYIFNPHTSNPPQLLDLPGSPSQSGVPACSHDGRYLAYTEIGARPWALVIIDLTKNNQEVFRDDSTLVGGNASWSRDGHRVVYMVYLSDTQSFELRMVTDFKKKTSLSFSSNLGNFSSMKLPAISPDGSQVAFVGNVGDKDSLYVAPTSSGSQATYLAPLGAGVKWGSSNEPIGTPAWDSSGEWIYFYRFQSGRSDSDLFRIHPDGSGLEDITSGLNQNEIMPIFLY